MQTVGHINDQNQPLTRLNAVRVITVLFIAIGYASTMPLGPAHPEMLALLGHDPSWIGIQVLFFLSGFLAMRSLAGGSTAFDYLQSRFLRNIPMLAVFTLIAVLIIYPALGVNSESLGARISKLGLYFFETVSCVDPGRALPGLLDEARYMCLIQGAVWTFRWGAIAHICAAIGGKLGVFKNPVLVAIFASLSILGYFIVGYLIVRNGYTGLDSLHLALRLSWPFLAGMAIFSYRGRLPATAAAMTAALAALAAAAMIWYYVLPWTPAIEILLTGFWMYAALLLTLSKTPRLAVLNTWPNMALALYLTNWPVAQLILLAFPDLGSLELIAISVPASMGIAYAAYILFSKRLYAFAHSRSRRQDTVSSPPALSQ